MSEQGVLPLRRISDHQDTVIRLFGRKRIERELRVRSSLDRADMTDLLNLRKKNGVIILAILPQCQPDSPSGWRLKGRVAKGVVQSRIPGRIHCARCEKPGGQIGKGLTLVVAAIEMHIPRQSARAWVALANGEHGARRATDHLVRSVWLGKVCRHDWIKTSHGHHNRVHGFLRCEIENCFCCRAETLLEADSVAQIGALGYVVFDPAFNRFGGLLALTC